MRVRTKTACKSRGKALLGILMAVLMMESGGMAAGLKKIQKESPDMIAGHKTSGQDRMYDSHTIFDYINGAGEVYRSYGMKKCFSRRYLKNGEPSILLDIFEMGTSEDAFGVFTHDLGGRSLNIGQGARYRSGWLRMWKDRFFISIYSETGDDTHFSSMKALAAHIVDRIERQGETPSILSQLPEKGLQSDTIRFFHDQFILNAHYYLSYENILNLGSETDAVLAEYRLDKEDAIFLVIQYPSVNLAREAYAAFRQNYLPDAEDGSVKQIEDGGWCGVRNKENAVAVVIKADSRSLLETIFDEWRRMDAKK